MADRGRKAHPVSSHLLNDVGVLLGSGSWGCAGPAGRFKTLSAWPAQPALRRWAGGGPPAFAIQPAMYVLGQTTWPDSGARACAALHWFCPVARRRREAPAQLPGTVAAPSDTPAGSSLLPLCSPPLLRASAHAAASSWLDPLAHPLCAPVPPQWWTQHCQDMHKDRLSKIKKVVDVDEPETFNIKVRPAACPLLGCAGCQRRSLGV